MSLEMCMDSITTMSSSYGMRLNQLQDLIQETYAAVRCLLYT